MELVLFESPEWGSNFPTTATIDRLAAVGASHGLTYTVHLPLDIRLGDDGSADHISLDQARRVIRATQALQPYGYVMHLDGRALLGEPTARQRQRWQEESQRALDLLIAWVGEPELLCVENVEGWDPAALTPILAATPVAVTVDVGHLWVQGMDPLPYLEQWAERTRVVHLHGLAARDHASLAHMPRATLEPVVHWLRRRFAGVVTLEVFGEEDFESSLAVLKGIITSHA